MQPACVTRPLSAVRSLPLMQPAPYSPSACPWAPTVERRRVRWTHTENLQAQRGTSDEKNRHLDERRTRPKTTDVVARRLISRALGIRSTQNAKEERTSFARDILSGDKAKRQELGEMKAEKRQGNGVASEGKAEIGSGAENHHKLKKDNSKLRLQGKYGQVQRGKNEYRPIKTLVNGQWASVKNEFDTKDTGVARMDWRYNSDTQLLDTELCMQERDGENIEEKMGISIVIATTSDEEQGICGRYQGASEDVKETIRMEETSCEQDSEEIRNLREDGLNATPLEMTSFSVLQADRSKSGRSVNRDVKGIPIEKQKGAKIYGEEIGVKEEMNNRAVSTKWLWSIYAQTSEGRKYNEIRGEGNGSRERTGNK